MNGLQVYANELNPVAAVVLKAIIEYPARYGRSLVPVLKALVAEIDQRVRERLLPFFYTEPPEVWWEQERERARREFGSNDERQLAADG